MRRGVWIRGTMLLAAAFVSGVLVGIAFERRQRPPLSAPTAGAHDAMHDLARDLDLDPEQQRAVAAILNRRQSEVDAAWHAMQPHVRAALDSTSKEILAVLRPDQAARYRAMIEAGHTQHHR